MKPGDLFWCPSCGEVFHCPNNASHRGVCRKHDAIMIRLDSVLTWPRDKAMELVPCSKLMIEELLGQDPKPVILVGIKRQDNNSLELIFKNPERQDLLSALNL